MIKLYPNPILKKVCEPYDLKQNEALLESLLRYMKAVLYAFDGVGLAAPQIGDAKRIFVIDITKSGTERQAGTNFMVFVNPEILESTGEVNSEEGCLSFPGASAIIKRASLVRVKCDYPIYHGETELEAEGLLARVIQHEMDHLGGKTLIDHVGKTQQYFIRKNVKKNVKNELMRQKSFATIISKVLQGENNG